MITRRGGGVAALALVAGCYTLTPVQGVQPQVGTRIAFDVNDAGRVALGGSMGPEIAQVEGHLIEKDGGSYLVAVSNVRLLRGGEQVWTGEQVRLRSEHVGLAYERRFSAGRTVGLSVVGIGGFAAMLATRSLLGSGRTNDSTPDDSTIVTARLGRP